jgi:hypothetical protein
MATLAEELTKIGAVAWIEDGAMGVTNQNGDEVTKAGPYYLSGTNCTTVLVDAGPDGYTVHCHPEVGPTLCATYGWDGEWKDDE